MRGSPLFVMICWVLTSCSACTPYTADLRPTDEWRSTDAGYLSQAAFEWNRRTVSNRHAACDVPICRIGDTAWLLIKAEQPPGQKGVTSRSRHTIELDPDLDTDRFYRMALHELGHAIGLGHTETGVMHKDVYTTDFTSEVIEECRHVNACP